MKKTATLVSIVIPCYNESPNIDAFYKILKGQLNLDSEHRYELLYVDDGSHDDTLTKLHALARKDKQVRVVALSRNFGKEIATTAGIHYAKGDAVLMIDADGQYPAELIPEFIRKWENGAQVVIGIRESNQKEGPVKRYGSKLFYKLSNNLTGTQLIPGTTDFRLLDRVVRDEFVRMTERNRVTRSLIDWVGFKQDYIYFQANARMAGEATYDYYKLVQLALNSFVSLSIKPLYFTFYAGLVILPLSVLLAVFSAIEMLIHDPLHLHITGTAYLVMLVLFLLGIVLVSQGVTALYLSHIHTETQNRPLFVTDTRGSRL
jgi:glycosyltransferase involved in cell wall biosynthesis